MYVMEYQNYKNFVNDWVKNQQSNGHGQFRQMSIAMGVNSVIMSQVFRGNRDLTLEQALALSKYIGLNSRDRDYFLLLVQRDKAGNHELKEIFEKQLEDLRLSGQHLKNVIKHQKLSEVDCATFYSRWYYSAIRLGVSVPELNSTTAISNYLGLERQVVSQVIDFLLRNNLIIEKGNGFDMGPQVTHIAHDSPFVNRHHTNWRIQAMMEMDKSRKDDLFYTGPMTLSKKTADNIKRTLVELISKTTKDVTDSDSETIRCLNIDWFEIKK